MQAELSNSSKMKDLEKQLDVREKSNANLEDELERLSVENDKKASEILRLGTQIDKARGVYFIRFFSAFFVFNFQMDFPVHIKSRFQ